MKERKVTLRYSTCDLDKKHEGFWASFERGEKTRTGQLALGYLSKHSEVEATRFNLMSRNDVLDLINMLNEVIIDWGFDGKSK